ncbi:hypothetical protein DFS34DRAFT_598008 [Phlyctochytrium arcticum]|nr:hypothetical protein DFS34DRAFT_598008 [Phlyctochytrium arcticum]
MLLKIRAALLTTVLLLPSVLAQATPSDVVPTIAPSVVPTVVPTVAPTVAPTVVPTIDPTIVPTVAPTVAPTTVQPTIAPTVIPTVAPTTVATPVPTQVVPTVVPTVPSVVAPTPSTAPNTRPTSSSTLSNSPSSTPSSPASNLDSQDPLATSFTSFPKAVTIALAVTGSMVALAMLGLCLVRRVGLPSGGRRSRFASGRSTTGSDSEMAMNNNRDSQASDTPFHMSSYYYGPGSNDDFTAPPPNAILAVPSNLSATLNQPTYKPTIQVPAQPWSTGMIEHATFSPAPNSGQARRPSGPASAAPQSQQSHYERPAYTYQPPVPTKEYQGYVYQ